jgi:hypothetical protein
MVGSATEPDAQTGLARTEPVKSYQDILDTTGTIAAKETMLRYFRNQLKCSANGKDPILFDDMGTTAHTGHRCGNTDNVRQFSTLAPATARSPFARGVEPSPLQRNDLADPFFPIRWCFQIDRHTQTFLTTCSMDQPDLSQKARVLRRFDNDREALECRRWALTNVPDALINLFAARYSDMNRALPSGVISSLSVEDRSGRSQGSQGAAQPPLDKKRALMNERRDGRFTAIPV